LPENTLVVGIVVNSDILKSYFYGI
jgi:hypothetical protein